MASKTLEVLKKNGFLPSFVITSPDRPQGRKMIVTPPPVKVWAEENHIPYIQPEKLDEKTISEIRGFDLFVVTAYGKIMPEELLKKPKFGSINIHYSLLPKYRGASPVESAILNGETKTGVSIQQMEFKMDSGAIIASEETDIIPDETAPQLRERLIKIGGELLVKTLKETPEVIEKAIHQNEEEATYCKKIKKEDGLINLKDNPVKNYNKFRAYANWPRTFFFQDRKRIIITKAKLENGQFVIEKVIPEGGKEKDFNTLK